MIAAAVRRVFIGSLIMFTYELSLNWAMHMAGLPWWTDSFQWVTGYLIYCRVRDALTPATKETSR